MKKTLLLSLLGICMAAKLVGGLHQVLNEEWNYRFVRHHQAVAELTGLANCWICTHSPISAKTMPYVAIPLSIQEIYNLTQGPISFMTNNPYKGNRSSLTVAQWVKPPWLIYNRTGKVQNGTAYVLSCFQVSRSVAACK